MNLAKRDVTGTDFTRRFSRNGCQRSFFFNFFWKSFRVTHLLSPYFALIAYKLHYSIWLHVSLYCIHQFLALFLPSVAVTPHWFLTQTARNLYSVECEMSAAFSNTRDFRYSRWIVNRYLVNVTMSDFALLSRRHSSSGKGFMFWIATKVVIKDFQQELGLYSPIFTDSGRKTVGKCGVRLHPTLCFVMTVFPNIPEFYRDIKRIVRK